MKKLTAVFLVFIVGVLGILFWWLNGKRPVDPRNKQQKIFVIEKGQGLREIASKLKKDNLIKDPVVFFLYVKENGLDKNIQAGDYRLSSGMNLESIAKELTHGTLDIWVTIPEGLRAEEVADILKNNFVNYNETWKDILVKNNGYLFPDTYLIPKDSDISLIVSLMRNNFYKKIGSVNLDKNANNLREVIIKASLLEREVKYPEEEATAASVIENRLRLGMPLQIDATVQYALGYDKNAKTWWKKDLTKEDLQINSLFNTYKLTGLPPMPVSNPGILSLRAAQHPDETDFIYYVSDKLGHLHFARNLNEHNNNVSKYIDGNIGY